jgi:hypothetical protein
MSMKFVSKLKGFADSVKDDLARRMLENSVYSNRLLFLSTLAQSPLPAGEFARPVHGDVINAAAGKYVPLYENDGGHPVAVTVYGHFTGVTGKQIKLGLQSNKATDAIVDYLSTSVSAPAWGVKRISDTVILRPNETLYAADARWNTALRISDFTLVAADKFVPRVFDLASYLVENNWINKV